jgi:hypothetical protein
MRNLMRSTKNWRNSMFAEIKLYRLTIAMSLLLLPILLSACAHAKPYYFNDSEKVYSDKAKTGVCEKVDFDCVCMSQGLYRKITTVNPGEFQ